MSVSVHSSVYCVCCLHIVKIDLYLLSRLSKLESRENESEGELSVVEGLKSRET